MYTSVVSLYDMTVCIYDKLITERTIQRHIIYRDLSSNVCTTSICVRSDFHNVNIENMPIYVHGYDYCRQTYCAYVHTYIL